MDLIPPDTGNEQDPRFIELLAGFTCKLRVGQFEAGKVLLQMSEEGVFGPSGNFRDLMKGGLRSSEVRGYQLINGYKHFVLLKEHGCPLPFNENQVRPLTLREKRRVADKGLGTCCRAEADHFIKFEDYLEGPPGKRLLIRYRNRPKHKSETGLAFKSSV